MSGEWSGTVSAGTSVTIGDVTWEQARRLWVRVRATYDASATDGITVRFYLFESSDYIDTEPFIEINPTCTAGDTVQETFYFEIPIYHSGRIEITNNDSTYDVDVTLNIWFDLYDYTLKNANVTYNWATVS